MSSPTHTIRSIIAITADYFKSRGIDTPRLDAELLLGRVLGLSRIQLYVNIDQPLENREVDEYRRLVRERGRRVPIAYILGNKEFNSMNLRVGEGVLVPRPDTEILVEEVLKLVPEDGNPIIADIGTGTGAIAISLAKARPNARVFAIDISEEALAYAETNVGEHNLRDRIRVIKGDLLSPLEGLLSQGSLDVIVSNPPYIPSQDIPGLEPEVSRYEPSLALDGGGDGLDFYRRITAASRDWLKPSGILAYEVGCGQAPDVAGIIRNAFPAADTAIHKDLAGVERVVVGQLVGPTA